MSPREYCLCMCRNLPPRPSDWRYTTSHMWCLCYGDAYYCRCCDHVCSARGARAPKDHAPRLRDCLRYAIPASQGVQRMRAQTYVQGLSNEQCVFTAGEEGPLVSGPAKEMHWKRACGASVAQNRREIRCCEVPISAFWNCAKMSEIIDGRSGRGRDVRIPGERGVAWRVELHGQCSPCELLRERIARGLASTRVRQRIARNLCQRTTCA